MEMLMEIKVVFRLNVEFCHFMKNSGLFVVKPDKPKRKEGSSICGGYYLCS